METVALRVRFKQSFIETLGARDTMYLLDDDNQIVNSELSLDQFEGVTCIVIESSGGASQARGIKRRNPDYNKLLSLLFRRLAKVRSRITRVILDSNRVSELPVIERIVNVNRPYPIDLNSVDIENFRKTLQNEVSRMHRDPKAKRHGNAQKRIRICLEKFVDVDSLIANDASEGDGFEDSFGPGLTETQRGYLRTARVGQGQFRKNLIEKYQGTCPLTGIKQDQLLIAAHIKPWKVCTNAERLDPSNGILLSAMADRLFDKGLISFSVDGAVLVSGSISHSDRTKCGIDQWQRLQLDDRGRSYMEYHRATEFKGT